MPDTTMTYALITGASAGLGREIAVQLAAMRKNLIITGRNLTNLEGLKEEIDGAVHVEIIQCDLSLPAAAQELYQTCVAKELTVDILINNAGQGMFGDAVDQDDNRIEHMLMLNIVSPTTLCGIFARDMKKRGAGHVMNIGSVAGNQPTPFFGSYSASKSYIFDYSVALHYEMRDFGIAVTCFVPGFIKTSFDANAQINSSRYLAVSERNALSAERVARLAIRAMLKKKVVAIGGFSNSAITLISKLVPTLWKAALIRKAMGWITA